MPRLSYKTTSYSADSDTLSHEVRPVSNSIPLHKFATLSAWRTCKTYPVCFQIWTVQRPRWRPAVSRTLSVNLQEFSRSRIAPDSHHGWCRAQAMAAKTRQNRPSEVRCQPLKYDVRQCSDLTQRILTTLQ